MTDEGTSPASTWNTAGMDAPRDTAPIVRVPGLSGNMDFELPMSASCSGCHHFFDGFPIRFVPGEASSEAIRCPNCGKRCLVLGGNSSHTSLASQETIPWDGGPVGQLGSSRAPESPMTSALRSTLGAASLGVIPGRFPSAVSVSADLNGYSSSGRAGSNSRRRPHFLGLRGPRTPQTTNDYDGDNGRRTGFRTSSLVQVFGAPFRSFRGSRSRSDDTDSNGIPGTTGDDAVMAPALAPAVQPVHTYWTDPYASDDGPPLPNHQVDGDTDLEASSHHGQNGYVSQGNGIFDDDVDDHGEGPSSTAMFRPRQALTARRRRLTEEANALVRRCPCDEGCDCLGASGSSSSGARRRRSLESTGNAIEGYAPGYTPSNNRVEQDHSDNMSASQYRQQQQYQQQQQLYLQSNIGVRRDPPSPIVHRSHLAYVGAWDSQADEHWQGNHLTINNETGGGAGGDDPDEADEMNE